MGRKIGPKHKICRRLGMRVCSTDKCAVLRRSYRAGQHGVVKSKSRQSEYGRQLLEKQKARAIYGIMERQFRNIFGDALKQGGETNKNLLCLLERRLDNVVFRVGLAKTRAQARQYISHGFIKLNDKHINIPSARVRVGDVVSIKKHKDNLLGPLKKAKKKKEMPSWITADFDHGIFSIIDSPRDGDLPAEIDASLIVEFYSR